MSDARQGPVGSRAGQKASSAMACEHASAQQAMQRPQQAARQAEPWVEGLGRFGYAAKGIVYLSIGILAGQAALGHGAAADHDHAAAGEVEPDEVVLLSHVPQHAWRLASRHPGQSNVSLLSLHRTNVIAEAYGESCPNGCPRAD